MQTTIDLHFADGAYTFKLGLAQIRELQVKTNSAIGAIYGRVVKGRMGEGLDEGHPGFAAFYIDDLRETVRQGLIGGGKGLVDGADVVVTSLRATELVERYFDPLPLVDQWRIAGAVMYALVEGYRDAESDRDEADEPDEPGDEDKKKAGGSTTPAP